MNSEADRMEVMEIYLIMLKLRIDLFTVEEMKSYLTMLKSRIDLTQQLVRMP
jgi:predicted GNAT family N-acyltransferase